VNLPEDFDYMKRGDAFAFLVKISKISARILLFILLITAFGKKFFSRKGIGLFTRGAPKSNRVIVKKSIP